jgi:Zn-dependent peptidase ImmA (M78 family)/transcriptional regulator with XRE-family HTH domain
MVRVEVKAELLRWARDRAGFTVDDLSSKFPKLEQWESGELQPTLKQIENYAKATYAPVGYFFLPEPPEEPLPVPDFRTMVGRGGVLSASPNLRDMIYACQERQDWFRENARITGGERLAFVGSANLQSPIAETAAAIRRALSFDLERRRACATWTDALRLFIGEADRLGILVMCSGIVMNNTHRRLDPEEFRGFALSDDLAPLVFINGADAKSAQMFTLAHELAHIWLGQTALSNTTATSQHQNAVETWCNRVAAELLAPLEIVRSELRADEPLDQTVARLARIFKVSSLVILQRLRDARRLSWDELRAAYQRELDRISKLPRAEGGGDFYVTAAVRYSRRFTRALVESTLEGRTLYRDALRMLGISKTETFHELGRTLAFSG